MQADYTNNRQALVELLAEHVKGERFDHSLCVEQTALELARQHGADEQKAGLAGLLHDITKQKDNAGLAREYGIVALSEKTLHGPVAAVWLYKQGIVRDWEVLTAIRYHTTGRADMTLLEKIIYMADYIEPSRDFEGVEDLRQAAAQDLNSAMLLGIGMTLHEVLRKGSMIDFTSVEAYNHYRWVTQR